MSEIQYAPAVGSKFYEDGRVRQFPGNTIICFADPQGEAYRASEWAQKQIAQASYGDKFAMLPPSSFHMTVMDLLCDEVREKDHWSTHLSLDATLEETDQYFIKTVGQVPPPDNFRMTFSHLALGTIGLSLSLQPADDETAQALYAYRDKIADVTGVRFPDHETYGFHLSLAYRIVRLTDDEELQLKSLAEHIDEQLHKRFGLFDTGQPVLTFFDDMFAFYPVSQRHTLASRA